MKGDGESLAMLLHKNWFLGGLICVILAAKIAPGIGQKHGPLHPEYTVKYGAVGIIFFLSGLSLKTEELMRAIKHVRLHLFIQSFSMTFVPALLVFLVAFLQTTDLVDPRILNGFLALGCMPPPVSSAVILTKAAGGNEPAAIFNSAFGSFLGIFMTPALLLAVLGASSTVPVATVVTQLSLTVVAPLVLGQVIRVCGYAGSLLGDLSPGDVSSTFLLLIIYSAFCDAFASPFALSPWQSFTLFGLVLVVMVAIHYLSFNLARVLRFSSPDVVAAMYCSSHKSLTLGIPLLRIIFQDSGDLSILSVPLLCWHPAQILFGSLLVNHLQTWIATHPLPAHRPLIPLERHVVPIDQAWEPIGEDLTPTSSALGSLQWRAHSHHQLVEI
eukprot:comp12014_c0_seq1/m.6714 comp12014_c0_seq1/g.6714  ORF comp12014_c0_seq1/g.6714 comp12014_c0_seq1/m.6714 type:complete len:385 (-) comp12014_c0_seq1:612-1766(-)